MGVIIGIIILVVVIQFVRGLVIASWNDKKSADMDENGNLRCKQCGCTSFVNDVDHKGVTVTKCVKCGHYWKTY